MTTHPAPIPRGATGDDGAAAFTPEEYEAVVNAIIASQALSGIAITRGEVDEAWELVKGKPLPDIGVSKEE